MNLNDRGQSGKQSLYQIKNFRDIKAIYGNLLSSFKNLSLSQQVLSCYFILLVTFICILIGLKVSQINGVINKITNLNYYSIVVDDFLDNQRYIKMDLDKINYQHYLNLLNSNLIFYKIYTMELNSKGLSTMYYNPSEPAVSIRTITYDLQSLGPEINNIYTDFNSVDRSNYVLKSTLKDLLQTPSENNNLEYDPMQIVPIIYNFNPLFSQYFALNGIDHFSTFFMGYRSKETSSCEEKTPSVYFKYPIDAEITTTYNNKIYDSTVEPVSACLLTKMSNNEIISRTNFYYVNEQSFLKSSSKSYQKMLNLIKLNQGLTKDDFTINYLSYKSNAKSDNQYIFTFGNKIDRNSYLPFLTVNEIGEKPYDYVSLLNFPDIPSTPLVDMNLADGIYFKNYNIDDNNSLVSNIPRFINNLYKYGMLPSNVIEQSIKDTHNVNIVTLMLTQTVMMNIWDEYNVNYYFDYDSDFFYFMGFINNFFRFSDYEKQYIKSLPVDTNMSYISPKNYSTPSYHKCSISSLKDYYQYIQPYYNCEQELCHFHNCNGDDLTHVKISDKKDIPNCYCIPMFCYDDFTNVTGLTDAFQYFIKNNYSFYNTDYFKKKKEIKCRLNFQRKEKKKGNDYFSYKGYFTNSPAQFRDNTTILTAYLIEDQSIIDDVIDNLNNKMQFWKMLVFIFYFVFLFIVVIIFYKCMNSKLNKFKQRIDDIKQIHELIIKNSQEEENDYSGNNIQSSSDEHVESAELNNNNNMDSEAGDQDENQENIIINVKNNKDFYQISEKERHSDNSSIQSMLKKEDNKERFYDELQEVMYIIYDNIEDFNIDIKINRNLYEADRLVQKFIQFKKRKFYKDILLGKKNKSQDTKGDDFGYEAYINGGAINQETNQIYYDTEYSMDEINNNMSLNIIYELLSTETVDFQAYKQNFYFKQPNQENIFNFNDIIEAFLYNDEQNYTNELTDSDKLETALLYYQYEIHLKWKEIYDTRLKNDEI